MSEIDEILERHQTTCSYEEDARYVYPEILKEVREALAAKEALIASLHRGYTLARDNEVYVREILAAKEAELAKAREALELSVETLEYANKYFSETGLSIRLDISEAVKKAREALK